MGRGSKPRVYKDRATMWSGDLTPWRMMSRSGAIYRFSSWQTAMLAANRAAQR